MAEYDASNPDHVNDAVQTAEDAEDATQILRRATMRAVRGVADLNYIDTEGERMTVIRRIVAERFDA